MPFLLPKEKIFACFWVLAAMPEGPALLERFLKLWQFFLMSPLAASVVLWSWDAADESSWEQDLAAPLCCPKPWAVFPSLVSGCSEGSPFPSWQRPAVPQGRCALAEGVPMCQIFVSAQPLSQKDDKSAVGSLPWFPGELRWVQGMTKSFGFFSSVGERGECMGAVTVPGTPLTHTECCSASCKALA